MAKDDKRRRCEEVNKDMISSLPNVIIGHILSFLPTKDAVSTCILSKSWRELWKSLSNFDFDDRTWKSKIIFGNFMDRFFYVHNSRENSITKLRLRVHGNYPSSRLSQWIDAAIKDNIEELILWIPLFTHVPLPQRLFSCEKLVVLNLSYGIAIDLLGVGVRFACLKVLHLEGLPMLDDLASIEKLLAGSPVLEELKIEHVDCRSRNALRVCSSSLKRLTIRFTRIRYDRKDPGCRALTLDTPNLELLILTDFVSEELNMQQLPCSLFEASISVAFTHYFIVRLDSYIDMAVQFLRLIMPIVRTLRLCGTTMRILSNAVRKKLPCFEDLPYFGNLTRLEIEASGDCRWMVLHGILKCSVKLEVFIIYKDKAFTVQAKDPPKWQSLAYLNSSVIPKWRNPEFAPRCMRSSLKVIECVDFEWDFSEIEMAEYFIKNALVLEKMAIRFGWGMTHNSKERVAKRLSGYERGSKACQITFSSP
ncbi:PREDICTED: F-box/LRR-repeat protein At4g14103-like [Populus euphratica]|uniref:F-box/LRR-repeat protein At4g14103-like n=1 Tax=Populus euphratica TaxID=75702 RepID=A0AAJ6UHG4_POPEU|nr:PREDICTED: F-box/LRR-repeat protein At4g14103-like [Populus euphratica]